MNWTNEEWGGSANGLPKADVFAYVDQSCNSKKKKTWSAADAMQVHENQSYLHPITVYGDKNDTETEGGDEEDPPNYPLPSGFEAISPVSSVEENGGPNTESGTTTQVSSTTHTHAGIDDNAFLVQSRVPAEGIIILMPEPMVPWYLFCGVDRIDLRI
jgi:hypothetical protein